MAAKGNVKQLISLAEQYIGTPYKWGGTSPQTGFDCSGFVQYVYAQQGISIPRTTYTQVNAGTEVSKSQLRPGDILFFEPTKNGPAHEGLYIGGGKFIEAPHTGANVRISSLAGRSDYVTARRIIPDGSPSFVSAVHTASSTSGVSPTGDATQQPSIVPPASVPSPTDTAIGASGVSMPGSVNYTIDPNHIVSLWQSAAGSDFVSPETQQMVQNANLIANQGDLSAGT